MMHPLNNSQFLSGRASWIGRRGGLVVSFLIVVALTVALWNQNIFAAERRVTSQECVEELKKVFSGDIEMIEKACECFDDQELHASRFK